MIRVAFCGEESYATNSFMCRFNYFLAPNNSASCFRSKHTFPEKLLKGVHGFEKVMVIIAVKDASDCTIHGRSSSATLYFLSNKLTCLCFLFGNATFPLNMNSSSY